MGRVLTDAEIAGLRDRHYWDYWNWAGPATQGEIVKDPVLGDVLASTDPQGRQWFIVGANPSLVAQVQLPEYQEDPRYFEAIGSAVQWEVGVAKQAVQDTADIVKPVFDLTTPILMAGAVVGVLYLLSQLPARR